MSSKHSEKPLEKEFVEKVSSLIKAKAPQRQLRFGNLQEE